MACIGCFRNAAPWNNVTCASTQTIIYPTKQRPTHSILNEFILDRNELEKRAKATEISIIKYIYICINITIQYILYITIYLQHIVSKCVSVSKRRSFIQRLNSATVFILIRIVEKREIREIAEIESKQTGVHLFCMNRNGRWTRQNSWMNLVYIRIVLSPFIRHIIHNVWINGLFRFFRHSLHFEAKNDVI